MKTRIKNIEFKASNIEKKIKVENVEYIKK